MSGLGLVAAGMAGFGASLLARLAVNSYHQKCGHPKLLPQIAVDLRKLALGTDTKEFRSEYLHLLRQMGRLAARQWVVLMLNLLTMAVIYAVACWPLAYSDPATPAFNPLRPWLSDLDSSFVVAAVLGSLFAPLVIRAS